MQEIVLSAISMHSGPSARCLPWWGSRFHLPGPLADQASTASVAPYSLDLWGKNFF